MRPTSSRSLRSSSSPRIPATWRPTRSPRCGLATTDASIVSATRTSTTPAEASTRSHRSPHTTSGSRVTCWATPIRTTRHRWRPRTTSTRHETRSTSSSTPTLTSTTSSSPPTRATRSSSSERRTRSTTTRATWSATTTTTQSTGFASSPGARAPRSSTYRSTNRICVSNESLVMRGLDSHPTCPARLFAYPAQSNFSGVQHPLEWVEAAQARGWDVLLDSAAFAPTNRLDLSVIKPDYVPVSFYKMFGYPTGVGALHRQARGARQARASVVRWRHDHARLGPGRGLASPHARARGLRGRHDRLPRPACGHDRTGPAELHRRRDHPRSRHSARGLAARRDDCAESQQRAADGAHLRS